MATNPIKLAVNMQSKALVVFNGSASAIPALFQSNTPDFEITAVTPGATQLAAYSPVDLSAFGLRMAIGPTPTGTSGGPDTLALAPSIDWTWNSSSSKFAGRIALNTSEVDEYIGELSERAAVLEINLTLGGDRITLYQGSVMLKAVVDELVSTVQLPVDTFLTSNESKSLFARKARLPGEIDTWTSENGLYTREFGVGENGEKIDRVITNS